MFDGQGGAHRSMRRVERDRSRLGSSGAPTDITTAATIKEAAAILPSRARTRGC